jgi:hypothetical protein
MEASLKAKLVEISEGKTATATEIGGGEPTGAAAH